MPPAEKKHRNAVSLHSESGAAFLEFCIVCPLLVFTFFSGIETARALGTYLRLSQIAYEGARYGASLPGLEVGRYERTEEAGIPAQQNRLHDVIEAIIQRHDLDATGIWIVTEHQRSAPPILENGVIVTVGADYDPLFNLGFPVLPLRVQASGPYLYPES